MLEVKIAITWPPGKLEQAIAKANAQGQSLEQYLASALQAEGFPVESMAISLPDAGHDCEANGYACCEQDQCPEGCPHTLYRMETT